MQAKDSFKVEVSKEFQVPVEKLYEAWNSPEQLKQWWKPMNNHLKEVTNDLKEGGSVRYVFENSLVISGQYQEVKQNERLVYTWNWEFTEDAVKNASYKLTVEFLVNGNGSSIRVSQDNFENEEGTLPHKEGWNKGLQDLEQFLSGTGNTSLQQQNLNAETDRSGGYNESPEQVKVGGG